MNPATITTTTTAAIVKLSKYMARLLYISTEFYYILIYRRSHAITSFTEKLFYPIV